MKQPLISVVLPVYNGQPYLEEAIASVLAQTMTDFELIIINDGSSDDSDSVVRSFDDRRISYHYQKNQGLAATLNGAIKQAGGRYIARQDQDDVSAPERFAVQAKFLDEHPEVGIVGSWAKIMVETEPTDRALKHPTTPEVVRFGSLFDSRLVHPSVMIRRQVFDTVGLYSTDRDRQPPEDYELWSRAARSYKLANVPEYLLTYREVKGSMSRDPRGAFMDRVIMISSENIAAASGRNVNDPVVQALAALVHRPTRAVVGLNKVTGLLDELAPPAAALGDAEAQELTEMVAHQKRLIGQNYQHGIVYRAARKVTRMARKLLARERAV